MSVLIRSNPVSQCIGKLFDFPLCRPSERSNVPHVRDLQSINMKKGQRKKNYNQWQNCWDTVLSWGNFRKQNSPHLHHNSPPLSCAAFLINLYLLQSWLLMNLFPCQESCNKSRVEKIETYTLEWNPFCQQVLLAC